MGFWATLFIQIIFAITSFILVKKYFGLWPGFFCGIFFATQTPLIEWGFMYVPLLSLLFFFLCQKTLNNSKYLPFLYLLFTFGCTTYTVFYALSIPLLYVTFYLFFQKNLTLKTIIYSAFLAPTPYLTLIIFDLRHNFLNTKNILNFMGAASGQGEASGYFIKTFFRAVEYSWLNQPLPFIFTIASVFILIFGAILLFPKYKYFVISWVLSSLILLSFYKGNISEYYYSPVVLLLPIFLSALLVKYGNFGKIILIILTIFLSLTRFYLQYISKPGVNLSHKIYVVNTLDSLNQKYSISYELPLGQDTGYETVFKTISKNYVADGTSELYTITTKNNLLSGTKLFSTGLLDIYKR